MDFYNTTFVPLVNTTTISPNSTNTLPTYAGFLFLLASSLFYGSNYLPVKQYDTGDGMFFQLVLCIGIWLVGLVVHAVRGFPKLYALPMFGGLLWSTGNNTVVPIIQTIGMGLGMIFWNSIGLITGWATARFGWFGIHEELPSNKGLNYAGVVLILVSTVFYLFVKTATTPSAKTTTIRNTNALIQTETGADAEMKQNLTETDENVEGSGLFGGLSDKFKRIVGIVLALFAGLLYGEAFSPILYIKDNYDDASKNNLDHLFSFYTGIVTTSLVYFVIYCILKKNKPNLPNQIILPGLLSGALWGIANTCYFLSNNALPQSTVFPIANSGPPIVASLWGVFLYKEIKGKRNFAFLLAGFTIAITGAILCGLSF